MSSKTAYNEEELVKMIDFSPTTLVKPLSLPQISQFSIIWHLVSQLVFTNHEGTTPPADSVRSSLSGPNYSKPLSAVSARPGSRLFGCSCDCRISTQLIPYVYLVHDEFRPLFFLPKNRKISNRRLFNLHMFYTQSESSNTLESLYVTIDG